MNVKVNVEDKKTFVEVSGRIDIAGAENLKSALTNVLESDAMEVVIDFKEVNFIGSLGIGRLLLFYKNFSSKGGQVSIINLNEDIATLFKAIKLNKLFNI